jgi:uncharacterized membrane protein YhaH (DUF805 family)
MNLVRLFFSFRGRLNRAGYWLVSLFWLVVAEVLNVAWSSSGASDIRVGQDHRVAAAFFLIVSPPIASCLAVSVRRLHDRNKSAWWLLLYLLVPILLEAIGAFNDLDSALSVIMTACARAIPLWALVDLGCLSGSYGTNRYGPDPLASV